LWFRLLHKRVSLTGVSTEERQLKKLANLVRNAA